MHKLNSKNKVYFNLVFNVYRTHFIESHYLYIELQSAKFEGLVKKFLIEIYLIWMKLWCTFRNSTE